MTLNLLTRLAFALFLTLPVGAQAETGELPPLPERNPARLPTPARNPVRVEAPAAEAPVLPGDAPTVAWTDAEVTAAKADCTKMLTGLALDYVPLAPIKEGICGAPAPMLLKAIGSDPKVEIDPPATVTCALAAGLSAWLSKSVQPNAKALLGAPVVKLHNATSYACRNRYGGETTPLSEHALANALDVSEFQFQSGERVTVLASWPHIATAPPPPLPNPTHVARVSPPQLPNANGGAIEPSDDYTSSVSSISTTSLGGSLVKAITAKSTAKVNPFVVQTDAKTNPFVLPTTVAKAAPSAPPAPPAPVAPVLPPSQSDSDAKSKFVRTVHDEACDVFGTVLGPEANEAHKNHFHLDMKARRHSAFCE
jgi:hypothetical protein